MKHLKTYKIFEGYSLDELTIYIKDMLLDFEDDGFGVNVKSRSIDRFDNNISISIDPHPSSQTFTGETFDSSRILIFTDRLKNYFDMEGIKYDIQYQWHDDKGSFKETSLDELELPSGEIQNMWIEIFVEKPV